MLAVLDRERRDQYLDGTQRRWLLDQVIADELLLQRALELGLARADPLARRRLVAALVDSITTGASDITPTEEELQKFHAEHPHYFRRGPRLELERIFIRVHGSVEAEARSRAEAVSTRLRTGESVTSVRTALGDEPSTPLSPDLLTVETIREYLGPTAARTAYELEVGAVSDPSQWGV
jgi:hypothetical protein